MKKSVLVISVLLFLIVVPMVFAFDTDITIQTTEDNRVDVRIYKNDMTESLESHLGSEADENGKIELTYSSAFSVFAITTFIKGEQDGLQKFKNITAGRKILIDLAKGVPTQTYLDSGIEEEVVEENITKETSEGEIDVQVEITDEAEEEESETETDEEPIEEEKQSGKITGAVVTGTKAFVTSKITYYVLGGILVALVLFFGVKFTRKKLKNKKGGSYIDFKVKNKKEDLDDKKDELDDKIEAHDDKLEDAEKKLQEAKQELDEIKNRKSKLQEAREKFERAKANLKKFED